MVLLVVTFAVDLRQFLASLGPAVAFVYLAPPVAAITVAAAIQPMLGREPYRGPVAQRQAGVVVVAAGLMVVVALAAVVMQPLSQTIYPTPAQRFQQLEDHVALVVDSIDPNTATTYEGEAFWTSESAWLENNEPSGCAEAAWSNWRSYVESVRAFALVSAGVRTLAPNAPLDEEGAAAAGNYLRLRASMPAARVEVNQGLEEARKDCESG